MNGNSKLGREISEIFPNLFDTLKLSYVVLADPTHVVMPKETGLPARIGLHYTHCSAPARRSVKLHSFLKLPYQDFSNQIANFVTYRILFVFP